MSFGEYLDKISFFENSSARNTYFLKRKSSQCEVVQRLSNDHLKSATCVRAEEEIALDVAVGGQGPWVEAVSGYACQVYVSSTLSWSHTPAELIERV